MHNPSSVLVWLVFAVPIGVVLWGVATFVARWIRLQRPQPSDSGQLLLGAVSQSLRERGELAASLGQLRTVHERLLDALPFGILWVNQPKRVAALNAEGMRLLQVKPGVIGLMADFVLEPFPWLREGLDRVAGPSWCCDGGDRRWRIRRIDAPDIVGFLLQFEDITEAELAERRALLRDRYAELGEMTAGVAHQLKNGLAVMKGHGQLLRRAGHGEVAEELLRETEDMERLVQRFLQWAKPLDPRITEVNLGEIAAQVLSDVSRRPQAQGRILGWSGSGWAQADPQLLHQALVNLVENGCQVTPVGGRVEVQVQEGRIDILDQGPGFGEETLVRMLRPFESGHPEGTGLGLPLAMKWLNAQGADLTFEPRPEGGTRVLVRW